MSDKKVPGKRLVSPRRGWTGDGLQVRYGIHVVGEPTERGRGPRAAHWAKCSVQLADGGRVPDGTYFLYTEEGKVHQLEIHRRQVALPGCGRLNRDEIPQVRTGLAPFYPTC